ncbi:carbohydrate esterase [Cladorrhinum samala]|uniref:S-formylglutathione hydrolase n=1 Tax=Cladorrhinum samala TaxID=585594 RepID=A0AAV9HPG0_9PEZI|nr:carbohydrate esterase [Cladorrhinum samala]
MFKSLAAKSRIVELPRTLSITHSTSPHHHLHHHHHRFTTLTSSTLTFTLITPRHTFHNHTIIRSLNTTTTTKMPFETKSTIRSFGGKLFKLSHDSSTTTTPMAVNLYLPPAALNTSSPSKVPLLIYLSGLTCTPENCSEKGFFQHRASQLGLAILYPDTSPRGLSLPGETESWDFGAGAGFYVNAAREPWSSGYKMEEYVTSELPSLLLSDPEYAKYIDGSKISITGHSMGGHGALTLYLKNKGKYRSVSAFAPICNPSNCPWGEKAFKGYLGDDRKEWAKNDATELIKTDAWKGEQDAKILVDVGTGDNFYKQGQLLPENFEKAVEEAGVKGVKVRYQEGYDHSYYFMASFADEHVDFAAKHLGLL